MIKKERKPKDTSWNEVSEWYNELLKGDDSYQAKVVTPNLLRILDIKKGEVIYDLACGQGYFSNIFYKSGARVIASDLSKNLIEKAKSNSFKEISYYNTPAHKAQFLKDNSVDKVVVVLAIQNIQNVNEVLSECYRILKNDGRIVLVLNHPSFRIPQGSDWVFNNGVQSRIVNNYMSESKVYIDMTPGEKNPKKKIRTVSFHRPLQYYVKLFNKNGFVITKLEEWISHKKSGVGPRQIAEDKARKEIPMFMCIEVRKA